MSRRRLFAAALMSITGFGVVAAGDLRADDAVNGILAGGAAFLAYGFIANPPQDNEPDVVTVGTGVFDAVDGENTAGLFRIEYRPPLVAMRAGPLIGITGTTDGGVIGYAGIRSDITFADRLLVSPNVSLCFYPTYGGGKDLGSVGQFRSGFDFQYKLDDGSRIGVSFHHISHAELFNDFNPGTETLSFTYTVPLGRF